MRIALWSPHQNARPLASVHILARHSSSAGKIRRSQHKRILPYERSQEDAVTPFPESLHDRWEGKPLWNLVTRSQALAELSARELCNLKPLFFRSLIGDVPSRVSVLLADVDHVRVVHDGHLKLRGMFLAHLLRLERPVEILAVQGALRSSHLATNDEMRGDEVFSDNHVLDCFARPGHFH